MRWRKIVIPAGLRFLGATHLHQAAAPLTRGCGVILTHHRVRPASQESFAPNQLLSVTPAFLEQTIQLLRRRGYDIVSMDEALQRLTASDPPTRRFAVLTFDDGFRDNLEFAVPILERLDAPAVFYITTGFADRTARVWWVELEEVVRKADRITVNIDGHDLDLDASTEASKAAAFAAIYWRLRRSPEAVLLDVIGTLCQRYGIDPRSLVERLCLDWSEVERLAQHPLATIGGHTVSHPMLAKHDDATVRNELAQGKSILETRLRRQVRHLSYPVGDRTSAGPREFRMAAEAGYASAVTTRPGPLFPAMRQRLHALPRISVNGNYQTVRSLDVLLSGVPFVLWNKGRRVAPL